MVSSIAISEIQKIPYIDVPNIHGRIISTLSFYVDGQWRIWLPTSDGLFEMKGLPAEGYYFAHEPERDADIYFHFLDFISQRACWPLVVPTHRALMEDFFNLSASVRKFDLLFEHSASPRIGTSRLVVTELEYLFILCRSIFDLLQEMIALQWNNVKLLDSSIKKKQLPKSFSEMVLYGDSLRQSSDISVKFSIPKELAEFYFRTGRFFRLLRTFRDKYTHGGTTVDLVYVTDRGFAVHRHCEPFAMFGVWKEADMLPNELCSLRPAIAYLVDETLKACEDYAWTIQSVIEYPPPVVPGFRLFMRGYFNESLIGAKGALNGSPWWN